jgi:hypothetical protein
MNIYGHNDNAHRGVTLGREGGERVDLHHARLNEDTDRFYYDRSDRPRVSQGHTGSSQVGRLSSRERRAADDRLREYGEDERNIPSHDNRTNCHNFASGAVGALESHGHARPGSHAFWESQNHRRQSDVAADAERDGRHFDVTQHPARTGPADHTYTAGSERPRPNPGRLNMSNFEHLSSRRRE